VRTGSWDLGHGLTSRWAIAQIYLWYKILSPHIELSVTSVALDKANSILYVGAQQSFRIWPVALLGYCAEVELTTKLGLRFEEGEGKYFIESQDDLYQTDQFARFVWFGVWMVVWGFQVVNMGICVVMAYLLAPVTWVEERWQNGQVSNLPKEDTSRIRDDWENEWRGQTDGMERSSNTDH
jgi:hypothetical protein